MGLDMYLYATLDVPADSEAGSILQRWVKERPDDYAYLAGWEFRPDTNETYAQLGEALALPRCEDSPHADIETTEDGFRVSWTVAYWRKVNAVHDWFVQHCQDGVDECQMAEVDVEQLAELLDRCRKVHLDPSLAPELLPTTDGFFFGGTEYDEWYTIAIAETVTMLEGVITAMVQRPGSVQFAYRSSW